VEEIRGDLMTSVVLSQICEYVLKVFQLLPKDSNQPFQAFVVKRVFRNPKIQAESENIMPQQD
jgi:hypothetical protein